MTKTAAEGLPAGAGGAAEPHGSPVRRAMVLVARQSWVRKAMLSTPVVRDVAWRFVAGENIEAGIAVLRGLNARGIKGTLNYVGTHVRAEADAVAAADAVVEAVRRIASEGVASHVSVKLTQIGLDVSDELCRAQLRRVLDAAGEAGAFVRVDMEESGYVDRTIALFEEVREAYGAGRVGVAVQSYLRHRQDDLERLMAGGSRIRLVKGGYWEPAGVVYRAKAEVDAAFLRDVDRLLRRGTMPAIATHDDAAVALARRVAAEIGLGTDGFEFQMLYGVRPELQAALVRDGYTVRCYVPYGGQWYEYVLGCIRRIPGSAVRRVRERARRRRR